MTTLLVTDRPDHPVLSELLAAAGPAAIAVLDPTRPAELAAATAALAVSAPGLVLLKSHDDPAIAFGRAAAQAGVRVLNDPEATAACLDRDRMARRAAAAGIAFPATSSPLVFGDPAARARAMAEVGVLAEDLADRSPLLVKSLRSRRDDLVARVSSSAELAGFAEKWPDELVVVQRGVPFDGWDHKVWVVGAEVFYARRRSPLDLADAGPAPSGPARLPGSWARLVQRVGEVYDLEIYGVDLIETTGGPLVVDVNPFPGGRSVPGVADAILRLVRAAGRVTDLTGLHAWARRQVRAGGGSGAGVRVDWVRAKPGRAVVAGYRSGASRFTARNGGPDGGMDSGPELFWFPDDPGLPALARVLAGAPELAEAVGRAGHRLLRVQPVRYKPGDRCVVRIELDGGGTLFGKVMAGQDAAVEADRVHRVLWQAATRSTPGAPWVARPVALVAGLGLTLAEGVPGGPPATPADLVRAARLLALLHGCTAPGLPVRDPGAEQRRLAQRAAALQAWAAGLPGASEVGEAAARLGEVLAGVQDRLRPEDLVATHGAFKPSQLVMGAGPDGRSVVVDLDGVAAGDPARDLGYLLAYLPRQAPAEVVGTVTRAYRDQRLRDGDDASHAAQVVHRAACYQAATLFKIAHRRVNRRQSPRPAELVALARRVATLLDAGPPVGNP